MAEESDGQKWGSVDASETPHCFFPSLASCKATSQVRNHWQMGAGDIVRSLMAKVVDDLPLKVSAQHPREACREFEVCKVGSKYDMRYELSFNRFEQNRPVAHH